MYASSMMNGACRTVLRGCSMRLTISAVSDVGCVREQNEDMVAVGDAVFRDASMRIVADLNAQDGAFLVAVSDGMGGSNAGEVASEMALRMLVKDIHLLGPGLDDAELNKRLAACINKIHASILNAGEQAVDKRGMGTTLVGAIFYGGKSYFINIGDSRVYRFRNGNLKQISRDHSLRSVTGNADAPANIIVNSLGAGKKVFVDFAPVGAQIINGDSLLLCSDGLSGELKDEEIESILSKEEMPVDMLLQRAKAKGGKDNISIILVSVAGEP